MSPGNDPADELAQGLEPIQQVHCGVCAQGVGAAAVLCRECQASYHPDCWKYQGGCSRFGCSAVPASRPEEAGKPMAPRALSTAISRVNWTEIFFATVCLLVMGGLVSWSAAFGHFWPSLLGNLSALMTLGGLAALGSGIVMLAASLLTLSMQRFKASAGWILLGILALGLGTLGMGLGLRLGTDETKVACEPVIDALTSFRTDAGIYPKKLDELVPRYLPSLPEPFRANSPMSGVTYGLSSGPDGPTDAYFMSSMLGMGFYRCSYNSSTKQWRVWD